MKKALKIIGIILVIVILALAIIPFAFQSQIQDAVKRYMNANLNAKVEFSDVNLSFFRSFPKAQVDIYDLEITNLKPFEDETLATAKEISFSMSVKELLKGSDEPIIIKKIDVDQALLTLKIDGNGNENFDILKEQENAEAKSFTYDIEDYTISKSALTYIDTSSDFTMHVSELEHSGHGRFTDKISELDTESEANVSLTIDSTNYLDNNHVRLSALIDMDINNQKYTFKENTGYINQLPLEFEGYVQQIENGQDIDISFKNPESSFKSFLAIIPEAYSKNFDEVETTGDFVMNGHIKGINSEERIPNIDIKIASDNASFKYPNLPKSVSDIIIKMNVLNTTGNMDDTYVNIETFNFRIDQDNFKSSVVIRELNQNMKVSAAIDGTINLANLTKAYPVEMEQELSGILRADINTNFDMEAIEKNAYERINNSGSIQISNMVFSSEALAKPVQIATADLTLGNGNVTLNNFRATTGGSDISATGNLNNLVGFVLSDKGLQGNFNVNSNNLIVSDFMTESLATDTADKSENQGNTTSTKDAVKIPAFLNCTINVNANNVQYDDLLLKDVKGALVIKDQQASIQNLTSSIFDGILAVQGNVSTKTDIPIFDVNIAADGFSIAKSFSDLQLLQQLAPVAKALNGTLNTNIKLAGTLDDSMSPNLKSISGNAFAELLATAISPETSKVIQELGGALNFIDFSKLDLRDLKTNLDFSDGLVNVRPFSIKYQDIEIVVGGSHSFDNNMNYSATFNVPAKYLGSEVNRLIGKINDNDVNKITIPVAAKITGTFNNPKVSTDLNSAVSNLTKQLIEIEKQKLLNNGKGKILEILGGIPKPETPKTTPADSTRKDSVPSLIKTPNIFKTDTSLTKKPVEENVKDILGGLIKNRKKDNTTPKKETPKDTSNQGNL